MNELIEHAIKSASIGQLCTELNRRMLPNTEIKVTARKIRVQHIHHCDNLMNAKAVDDAWKSNSLYKIA